MRKQWEDEERQVRRHQEELRDVKAHLRHGEYLLYGYVGDSKGWFLACRSHYYFTTDNWKTYQRATSDITPEELLWEIEHAREMPKHKRYKPRWIPKNEIWKYVL